MVDQCGYRDNLCERFAEMDQNSKLPCSSLQKSEPTKRPKCHLGQSRDPTSNQKSQAVAEQATGSYGDQAEARLTLVVAFEAPKIP